MSYHKPFRFKLKQPESFFKKDLVDYLETKKQMIEWCRLQKFDPWRIDEGEEDVFYFYSEKDYALFLLRWS